MTVNAEAMFPSMATRSPADDGAPAAVKAQREPASAFFDAQSMFGGVKFAVPEGATPQQRQALEEQSRTLRTLAADSGMKSDQAQKLADLIGRYQANPPSAQDQKAFEGQAVDQLKREFGTEAAQALADASTMSKRDPRLLAMLERANVASHPDAVLLLARLGRAMRNQGKFR